MAGSYNHCVDKKTGKLYDSPTMNDMIENRGDVYEAVEQMYGMIWFLAGGDADVVERARRLYVDGIAMSPGLGEDER